MRHMILVTLLAATVTPVAAASRHAEEAEAARAAQRLNDPALQSSISGMMVAMTDALMDVRVDKLRAAIARIDPDGRYDNDRDNARTVGDMVERDDPHFRDNIAKSSRQAVGTMGAAASGMADMLPELREMGERIARQVDKAMERIPTR